MRKTGVLVVIVTLMALTLIVASGSAARFVAQQQPATIRLQAVAFNPQRGERPAIAPELSLAASQTGRGYYIVQFSGPVQEAWKNDVAALGGEFLGYVPDYAFKVRLDAAQVSRVQSLANVAWVGDFQPAYKISSQIERDGSSRLYRVRVEQGVDAGFTAGTIAQVGAQILRRDGNMLLVAATGGQLTAVAHVSDVAWIENFVFNEKHNETGAGLIMGSNVANAAGYDGSTQIAAVADTGIGGGTAATVHADIPASRVTAIFDWPAASAGGCYTAINDGAQDVDSGHGTHVAGSVLSDGNASGVGKGTAPAAHLVFQAVEDFADMKGQCSLLYPDGYYLLGLPDDLHNLFQQAYNAGARIHANSWGSDQAGLYTLDSSNTDDFIWDNPDMTITFSAGNEGVDANNNGVVDNDSIGSPATAKNVITIGASENARSDNFPCDTGLGYTSHDPYQPGQTCGSMGGLNWLGTAGSRWGFTTEPLNSDPTGGNAEQMAPFSSRGPTDDGRIKPDVVAPGAWILSTYSGMYQEGYDPSANPRNGLFQSDGWGMPFNGEYKYFGGTSMSNPLAAGAATVVRDYYQKAHGHAASAALTKATLINSAVDLLDENNDGSNDNDFPIPNMHEGWGRINVNAATDGSLQFVDNSTGIGTGGSVSYQYSHDGSGPFKATLVWSDFAAAEAAATTLVNNLNLTVTAPNGTTVYRGNNFSGGWSQTGGSADGINNVENVYVQNAGAGTWTVTVTGANVPQGPQRFALVVDAAGGGVPTATPTPIGPTPTPTNTPVPPTPTNTPAPAGTIHVGDLDGSSTAGGGGRWNAQVTITVHTGSEVPASGVTVTGSWSAGGSASCVTNGSGVCSVSKNNLKANVSSVNFTVTSLSDGSSTYNSGANHDPDGDSNGTVITVVK
ncbi:MAG: S8 family serine peptidase [Chloroflexota bacterium]